VVGRKSSNTLTAAHLRFQLFRMAVLPFLPSVPPQGARMPVAIGAIGGSGTRVLPSILRLAGFWMGAWINPKTQDAMAPRYFLQRHFAELANHRSNEDPALIKAFLRVTAAHRWGMPDPGGPWGWKNPRSMWIIPFLAHVYPEFKFIHIVRDGRDMALSDNTNLLRKHGDFLLDDPHCRENHEAAQLRLWTLGNRVAYEDGTQYLGTNYSVVNYETLCARPHYTLERLFAFLSVEADEAVVAAASRLIVPSAGIGRWRKSDLRILQEPDEETLRTLALFGYGPGYEAEDDRRSSAVALG